MSRRYRPFDPLEGGRFDIPADFKMPRPTRRFWIGLSLIGIVILLLFLIGPIVNFATELAWYRGLGLEQVFLTRVTYQFWLFWGSFLVAFAYIAGNVMLALRLRGGAALRTLGIRRRYLLTPAGLVGTGAALLLSLIVSLGLLGAWQDLALFLHAGASGITEPIFNRDVSFYMLTLPFVQDLVGWAMAVAFLSLLLIAALYTIRGEAIDLRLTPVAIAHLSGMLAVIAAVAGLRSFIRRYEYLYSHNGVVWGAGYTDVNARMALALLGAVVAWLLCLLLLANIGLRRLSIPPAAIGAWAVMGVIGGLVPAVVQGFIVAPSELSREQPYIQREIEFTRRAYGLDHVRVQNYTGDAPLTNKAIQDDRATIDNLRLWDYRPLLDTYGQLQTIRTYYNFHDIDLDRYVIDGRYQQLELSARELDQERLPQQAQTWVNQKLTFTHGYGLAASPVNAVVGEGVPEYVARDLPPAGTLSVTRPAIYFGEAAPPGSYVLAPSAQQEFDYAQGGQDVYTNYTGSHGVPMDGTQRVLWSLRTRDFNLLISPQIQARTQMLYRRNIADRVAAIAPFLSFDADPYIVDADGRLYWVMDGYTQSDHYPYSQAEDTGGNYIRNSVKVVVDAYEGTPVFYTADTNDPVLRAYRATFPSLFKPIESMPAAIKPHLRVPEQLFSIQSDVYRTYHMSDPRVFYNREDVWAKPNEQTSPNSSPQRLDPYYVLMRLPGETKSEYLLILPFTPNNKQNMISWLAVRNDAPHYGELVSFQLPKDKVVFGPQQIANRIQENPQISRDFSLLNQGGSQVIQGNLLVVPVGDSFLYFEPIYLRATGTQSLPELKKVILADSRSVVYEDTLTKALDALVGTSTSPSSQAQPPVPSGGTPPSSSAQVADLTRQALQHYQAAQDKLKAGDLAGYAQEIQTVGQLLQQINSLTGAATPSPSPKPTP